MSSELVYDLANPTHRYLRHFEVPQFADYKPLRRILATPSKTRCRKSAPICILTGAIKQFSAAQQPRIFTYFRATPTRSGPEATLLHSVGGPFATCIFTVFRATPTRSGPGATLLRSVGGPFAHLASDIQRRTANLVGPCGGLPRCRAPSVLGPGASFAVVSPRLPIRHILRDKLTR